MSKTVIGKPMPFLESNCKERNLSRARVIDTDRLHKIHSSF